MWRSQDGGHTWSPTDVDSEVVKAITFAPAGGLARRIIPAATQEPANIYVATQTRGVLHGASTTVVWPAAPSLQSALRLQCSAFAGRVSITLDLASSARDGHVRILDVSGRRVRDLYQGPLGAHRSRFTWDGRLDGGQSVSSGVYYVMVTADRDRAVA